MQHPGKSSTPRTPTRTVATTLILRRAQPAWIDAAESGVAFSAASGIVTPRVRDGLVLRLVAKRSSGASHAHGGR